VLQCVAVCCSVRTHLLRLCRRDNFICYASAWCSVSQCVGSVLQCANTPSSAVPSERKCWLRLGVLQCFAVCCSVLQWISVYSSVRRHLFRLCRRNTVICYASVWCNMVQCVAVCCSVWRYVAVCKHTFFDSAVATILLDTPRVHSLRPPPPSDEARTVDSCSFCVECANSLKSASKSSTSASNTNCSKRMYESWHIYTRHGACCSAQNTGMSYGTYESDLRSVAVCCSVLQCVLHCSKHMHELWLPLGMYDGTYE